MNMLYDRITMLCAAKGISGSRMCVDLGLSKSTMSEMKAGRTKGVSTATAQKIAAYFDVSVGYLLGEEDTFDFNRGNQYINAAEKLLELLRDEQFIEIFDDFRKLDQKKRKIVMDLIRSLTE